MSDLPVPRAERFSPPSWRDGRLLVGVLLVVVAALLGARAVAAADDRVPVLAARSDLASGDPATADSFVTVLVHLGEGSAPYAVTGDVGPDAFLVRQVRAGELVPRSALGTADDAGVQPLTVRVDAVSATGLTHGSVVDVYVSPPRRPTDTEAGPAVKALEGVAVAGVVARTGSLGAAGVTSVQLLVPVDHVADVIEAVDSESRITLVPVPGAVTGDLS